MSEGSIPQRKTTFPKGTGMMKNRAYMKTLTDMKNLRRLILKIC
jgi:hypothetical protein